ncbi:MAG: ATP-binding protein [Xanthomonadales bacterium]|jgi:DNA gyrase subunit B|nr:ATP-binding protein [Xanthomonadales bacterium]
MTGTSAPSHVELIRKRPGMYVGDTDDGSGIAHMVWEVVGNAVDQFLAGHCSEIRVTIQSDASISVEDDGLGIRVDLEDGVPYLQRVLTELHTTATRDGHAPHEHIGRLRGGLHGVGLCPVNALSQWLIVDSWRDGQHHRQHYALGVPTRPVQALGITPRRGTRIHFLPDPAIFPGGWIDPAPIARRLRELSFLLPSLSLEFSDQRQHRFHHAGGIADLVEERIAGRPATPMFRLQTTSADIHIEVAAAWTARRGSIDSYANVHPTRGGGSHVRGLLRGLVGGLRRVQASTDHPEADLHEVVERGLVAVIQVRLADPTFGAPTTDVLSTPAVDTAVSAMVATAFEDFLRSRPEVLDHLRARLPDADV